MDIQLCREKVFILGLFSKRKNKKKPLYKGELMHVEGLPLAENTPCNVMLNEEEIIITYGNSEYRLMTQQVELVDFKTDVEIQQIMQSSLVKGVAGGILFGPVGAIIGSRVTNKEKRIVTGFAIINYLNSEGDLAPLLFSGIAPLSAAKFVDSLRPLVAPHPRRTHTL